ncbi:hypothetical protein BDY21DRAFT_349522 [Lineolata rhizophorae]|uniref:NACHT domain-containing protein n=1 Tax=Lineolata rhizophorae TaxID=578093 RepID=A0A6A6NUP1_9PEZI|nr:hypothetical protein BDY21DRAFT_349522 [Lineolata rhizophorae]
MAARSPSSPSTPSTSTPFRDAIDEFIQSYPKKKKLPQFLASYARGAPPSIRPEDVQSSIEAVEHVFSQKKSTRFVRATLDPIVVVLKDYTAVINSMSQADPMPTAIVWGCVKAAVDCSSRFVDLYAKIESHLKSLSELLRRFKDYEELFGHSSSMRALLKSSYGHVIRFWVRVEEECKHSIALSLAKAVVSFSTRKLDDCLEKLKADVDDVNRLVPIVQERLQKGERENGAEERRKAGIARDELFAFIKEQRAEQKQREADRRETHRRTIREWIRGHAPVNESNFRHHREKSSALKPGTCEWLAEEQNFQAWFDSQSSSQKLWLKAAPGVGKSVLCAFAIQRTKDLMPESGVAFQYFSFDEQLSGTLFCRNMAEQLFDSFCNQRIDLPESFVTHVHNNSNSLENLLMLIRLMAEEMTPTYVLLDGLDEETQEGTDIPPVITYLNALADLGTIKLWCSSQDRPHLRLRFSSFDTIHVDEKINSKDISDYISHALSTMHGLEVDQGTKTLVLDDLVQTAGGNFLWAAYMVNDLSKAGNEANVLEQMKKGLPADCDKYYAATVGRIDCTERGLASRILSCIVYAKRPLYLHELCEAMGMCAIKLGENMSSRNRLFKSKVEDLCAPLVEVQRTGDESGREVCCLSHSSVRTFLLKNRDCLQKGCPPNSEICSLRADVLADICFKYLNQPRYERMLKKKDDTFKTATGEDIDGHQLLSYAAKYWDKHLDDVSPTPELCAQVLDFIKSRRFQTCMQVQSLFIEGQFQFWASVQRPHLGPQLRRTFPWWLTDKDQGCGAPIREQYHAFVGQWGYFLTNYTSSRGPFAGEIDRCLWSSFGPNHMFYKNKSRLKSHLFIDKDEPDRLDCSKMHQTVSPNGTDTMTFKLDNKDLDLNVRCQKWSFSGGHRPRLVKTQTLSVPRKSMLLYTGMLRGNTIGRPPPVTSTPDMRYLRIGPQIFVEEDDKFVPLNGMCAIPPYFEEIASHGHYLAVTTRQKVTERDLFTVGLDDITVDDFGTLFSLLTEIVGENATEPAASSSEQSGSKDNSSDDTVSKDKSTDDDDASSVSSRTSIVSSLSSSSAESIEQTLVDKLPEEVNPDDVDLNEDDGSGFSSSESISARESWSEGSTEPQSDETEDEEQWNDWLSSESGEADLEIKDAEDSDSDFGDDASQASDKVLQKMAKAVDERSEDLDQESDSACSVASTRGEESDVSDDSSESYSPSDSSFDDDDDDESANEHGARIDDILSGKRHGSTRKGSKAKIQIFDTRPGKQSKPLFHLEEPIPGVLFDSPPVFHPSAPLVVWSLGSREILFVDYLHNTYFTRTLHAPTSKSCPVFIRPQFSPCGEYLHFASLEATPDESTLDKTSTSKTALPTLKLLLHVSTHRLSHRKTSRSPPRLLHRITISFGSFSSLSVTRLPLTLTWSPEYLYVSRNDTILHVLRVPLFPRPGDADSRKVWVPRNQVFMPESALKRPVHFFPPPGGSKKTGDLATVIVGAYTRRGPGDDPVLEPMVPKCELSAPIGVYVPVDAELGGWIPLKEANKTAGDEGVKMEEGAKAGRLLGKFEKFDRTEDCDIVPYLIY